MHAAPRNAIGRSTEGGGGGGRREAMEQEGSRNTSTAGQQGVYKSHLPRSATLCRALPRSATPLLPALACRGASWSGDLHAGRNESRSHLLLPPSRPHPPHVPAVPASSPVSLRRPCRSSDVTGPVREAREQEQAGEATFLEKRACDASRAPRRCCPRIRDPRRRPQDTLHTRSRVRTGAASGTHDSVAAEMKPAIVDLRYV